MIRLCEFLVNQEHRFNSLKISFPERGHSYLECDRDMGLINTKSPISIPKDWFEVFRVARENPSPYFVIEASQDLFLDFETFLKPRYRATNPVPTQPIREIKFSVQNPGIVLHRDNWNGNFSKVTLVVKKKNKTTRAMEPIHLQGNPKRLYQHRLPISLAKFKDLQVLKQFTTDSEFFDNLPKVQSVPDHFHDIVNDKF